MIRLMSANEKQTIRIASIDHLPQKLQRYGREPILYEWYFYIDGARSGIASVRMGCDGTALIEFALYRKEKLKEVTACLINRVITELHPLRIEVYTEERLLRKALRQNLFYEKGTYFQRVHEPLRDRLPDACFDEEGYLINQGLMDIPFGLFSTKRTGCGWIAAYNLIKCYGAEKTMQEVIDGVVKANPLGGLVGQDELSLFLYLKKQGFPVHLEILGRKRCLEKMEDSAYGILLYHHAKMPGSHFAAYRRENQNQVKIWNAVYGKRDFFLSPKAFFDQYTGGMKYMLIWIEK